MWSYFELPPISAVCTIKSDNRFFSEDDLEEDEDLHKAHTFGGGGRGVLSTRGASGNVFAKRETLWFLSSGLKRATMTVYSPSQAFLCFRSAGQVRCLPVSRHLHSRLLGRRTFLLVCRL